MKKITAPPSLVMTASTLVLMMCVISARAAAPNLIINGGFESSPYMSANFNSFNPLRDGWSGSGNFQVITNGLNFTPAQEGTKALVFNAGQKTPGGIIEQSVEVNSGSMYRLSYWLRHDGSESATTPGTDGLKAQVLQTGGLVTELSTYLPLTDGYVLGQWYRFALDFWTTTSPVTIRFTDISTTTSLKDISLDNVSLSSVNVVLGLEKSGSLTNAWQPAVITSDMITPEGKLDAGALAPGNSFYRMKIEVVPQ